jgi:glucitol/sorbitol PTS system EIIC component
MLDTLADWAEEFISIFERGAEVFVGLVVGIIPLLIVLLTAVNAFIALVGPERVDKVGDWAGRPGWGYTPIRYLIWPFLSVFFLTNPMAYTNGRFLPEKFKPAFYDSAVSMVHPPLGLFPHVNPGELFVWLGIATGVAELGLDTEDLAVRYLITGFIVIYIRGVTTAFISSRLGVRQDRTHAERLPSTAA